ncbi:MAG TPA: hypothetical protein VF590_00290, partial [Isosphaeraceae bacterium]
MRKYDFEGNEAWTRQFGTTGSDGVFSLAVDATGVYTGGTTNGTFPGQSSAGFSDAFVGKLDSGGGIVWIRQFGSAGRENLNGLAAYGTGVYAVGRTEDALPGHTNVGADDGFVRKYDPSGVEAWTRQIGTEAGDTARAVFANATGVYVAAGVGGTVTGTDVAGTGLIVVRKYDAGGNDVWTRRFGDATGFGTPMGITGDATGLYLAGETSSYFTGLTSSAGGSDAFVAKLDYGGNLVWINQIGSENTESGLGVAVGATDVYLAGDTDGTLPGQAGAGGRDGFLARFDKGTATPNAAPVNTVPLVALSTSESVALAVTGISVADPDA